MSKKSFKNGTPGEIQKMILDWYRESGRDLPWRHTREPYAVLVSEIMLQQTQVSRGLLFYDRWLKKFPTWEALAEASNAEVIRAWSGLGYNRRALALRDIAVQVVEGGLPESEEAWLKLKGIGPYTAAALTVFSLQQRAYPVDTNIRRVIGRLALKQPYPDLKHDAEIKTVLEEIMQGEEFVDVPQGLFDISTMFCQKTPVCAECPLKDFCHISQVFLDGKVPPPSKKKKVKERIQAHKKFPDRIFRGRILGYVKDHAPVKESEIGPQVDEDFNEKRDGLWMKNMIERLIKDKLLKRDGKYLSLPE